MLRFSIPAFVLAFLILSIVLASFEAGSWKYLWAGVVSFSALLCFGQYFSLSATQYDGWGIWSGKESRLEYLSRKMKFFDTIDWVDKNLSKDARMLAVGDSQVLYYPRLTYANSVFDEQFFAAAARKEKDPKGILRRLKEMGITYVIIDKVLGGENSHEYHQYELDKEQWLKIDGFVQGGLEPLNEFEGLYKVREKLMEKGPHIDNPFHFFPPQCWDYFNDFSNKDYEKSKNELERLLSFFPGDYIWLHRMGYLMKKSKI
jgi:hypothetical protein